MQHGQVLLATNRLSNHSFNSLPSALHSYGFLLYSVKDKGQRGHAVSVIAYHKSFRVKNSLRNVKLHRIESCFHRLVFRLMHALLLAIVSVHLIGGGSTVEPTLNTHQFDNFPKKN